jgi:trehalose synthase
MAATHRPRPREVELHPLDAARLEPLIGRERMARVEAALDATEATLAGRTVIKVNSTANGGGVAEMLYTLISYSRGAGIDTRWLVIEGDALFFSITKRIHNRLYGSHGDGGELGEAERKHYESVLKHNGRGVLALVRPGDVVVLHDPQPAGLTQAAKRAGARVIWRCHVGRDQPNEWTEQAWTFLRRYVEEADAFVVSRRNFAAPWMDPERVHVMAPSLDPFSAKNEPMSSRNVRRALGFAGLLRGDGAVPAVPFTRRDGSAGWIDRHANLLQTGPPPPPDVPLVVQVSRWDRIKDMPGVLTGFVEHVDTDLGAHLLLVGPAVAGVADDREAGDALDECMAVWRALPRAARSRTHLACIPMDDPDENAAIVNAIQRHAAVIVQKSLAEGFGLTVAEAMWKARPVVASRVGGIADQITHGRHGLLIDDPLDLASFGRAVTQLLRDPEGAEQLGRRARARVVRAFLGDRHLLQFGALLQQLS